FKFQPLLELSLRRPLELTLPLTSCVLEETRRPAPAFRRIGRSGGFGLQDHDDLIFRFGGSDRDIDMQDAVRTGLSSDLDGSHGRPPIASRIIAKRKGRAPRRYA